MDGSQSPRIVAKLLDATYPTGIAPCGDGTPDYIVVFHNHHAARISGVSGDAKWTVGSKGTGSSNFNYPWGVAVLPGGQVVVADSSNNRLQVLDIHTGKVIKQLGNSG